VAAMAQRNNKYDRQLRIWGEHGQSALERARVCVLNCGPTGSEALKNLVLGGIGSFTIVDASKVSASDLGNNYLVDWESMGQSKAKSVCALLQELNESVGAKFVEESPEALLESNPAFFAQFTLVIATQMTEAPLLKLEEICRQQQVMLVIARSYGLSGLVRLSVREHDIIESKPDNKVEDLRLHKPWPELQSYVDEFDIDTEDNNIHKHIPFAVLLIKIAEDWKKVHDGTCQQMRECSRKQSLLGGVSKRTKTIIRKL
jgi:amyloid beta precursor protein binding protein 1